jgi:hypothetical protein
MKTIAKLFIFAFLLSTVGVAFVHAESYSPAHDKVKKLFQSNAEKSAKDAVWTQRGVFKVGVIDDRSSRNGYASYVCETLYDYGFKGQKVWVQVIDIVKLTRNNKWVKLGEAHCR